MCFLRFLLWSLEKDLLYSTRKLPSSRRSEAGRVGFLLKGVIALNNLTFKDLELKV